MTSRLGNASTSNLSPFWRKYGLWSSGFSSSPSPLRNVGSSIKWIARSSIKPSRPSSLRSQKPGVESAMPVGFTIIAFGFTAAGRVRRQCLFHRDR